MSEAKDRYDRSLSIIKSRGIPYLESLPLIESEADIVLRNQVEIILRVRCLIAVARAAYSQNLELAKNDIEQWSLEGALTPRERKALEDGAFSDRDRIDFTWAVEAVVPLIWAAGLHDNLYFPDQTADAESLVNFVRGITPDVVSAGQMQSPTSILNEADLIYRLHWATRQAFLDDVPNAAGLDTGVVQERHRALNWLIGYDDSAEWDEVTTDT